jgi:hypothetical protein
MFIGLLAGGLAPITAVEDLEASRAFAGNCRPGVPLTELYLPNWPASGVKVGRSG